jgi:hypothetical protein
MLGRRLVYFAVMLAVAIALAFIMRRPGQPGSGGAGAAGPAPPADIAAVTILKRSGGPCGVEILGTVGSASNLASASLAAGAARSIPLQFPAPYTIEAVTVMRAGAQQRWDVKMTLAGGRRYEILVNPDDTIALLPASP